MSKSERVVNDLKLSAAKFFGGRLRWNDDVAVEIPEAHAGKAWIPEGGNFESQGAMFDKIDEMHSASVAPIAISDEYKEKGWAKGREFKNTGELFKEINELQELKGKKDVAFDYEGKTENEIEAHLAISRPENAESYKFPEVEEGKPNPVTDEDKKFYGELLHKAGVDTHKGNAVINAVVAKQAELKTAMFSKESMEEEFAASFKDSGDWKKAAGETANSIKANLNAEDQELLKSVPNKFLGLIYRLQDKTTKAYGINPGEDRGGGGGNALSGEALETKRKELRTKIGDLRGKNGSHTEILKLDNELAATYKDDPRISKK